ncbi:MAG: thiol reductant ABC exporter subunit CydD [Anaerolineae bacterium]|nr:thiol reductant ABC exporter subunit CydD [Anaerolineae bacterium]
MNFIDARLIKQIIVSRGLLAAAVGFGFINGILVVLQAYILSTVIAQVFQNQSGIEPFIPLLWALFAILFLRGVCIWLAEWYAGKAAVRVKDDLRRWLQEHLFLLGPAYVHRHFSGEITTVVTEGVESLDAYISQYLPQVALAGLIPLVIVAVVFPVDPISGIILFLTAPLIPVFMVLIAGKSEAATRRNWTALRRMSVQFLDTIQGLLTLKALNQTADREKKIEKSSDQYRRATLNVLQIAFLSALVLELVGTISTAILAVGIGLRLLKGTILFQESLFILFIAPEFYLQLRQLGIKFHAGIAGVTSSERIFEILDSKIDGQDGLRNSGWSLPGKFSICFQSVGFSYPDKSLPVLSDVSFRIESGQMTAIVGRSGAGKTTLFHLLLKFISPGKGAILINEFPFEFIPQDIWREQICWVSQSPSLFNKTILENVKIAKPSATMDEIARALQMAGLEEFIQALPSGYDTLIGENGMRLSGGQRQRLALARAFLRDAPIVLFDEPTAMLDPEQEALMVDATRHLRQNRTVIVIAHRLETIRTADQIIFLENGSVIESGSHDVLVSKKGGYFRMIESLCI